MHYQDKVIVCVEETCESPNKEFIVTAESQKWLAEKGWPIPKRCKTCRENRKNREQSPFKAVADQFKRGDYNKGGSYKKKNNRRHGRERMDDFEGNN